MKNFIFVLFTCVNIYAQQTINLKEIVISKKLSSKELIEKILQRAKINYGYNDSIYLNGSHISIENIDTVNYFVGTVKTIIPNYIKLHNILHKSAFYDSINSIKYHNKKIYNTWFPIERAKPYEECIPWYFPFYLTRSFEYVAIRNIPCIKKFQDYTLDYQIGENGLITVKFKAKENTKEAPIEGVLIVNGSDYAILNVKFNNFKNYDYNTKPHFYEIKKFSIDISYSKNIDTYSVDTIKTEMQFCGYGNKEKIKKEYKSISVFEKSEKSKIKHLKKLFPPYI